MEHCQCCDGLCPTGHNAAGCVQPATCTLYRVDMVDESGTALVHESCGTLYVDVNCTHCGRSGCLGAFRADDHVDW